MLCSNEFDQVKALREHQQILHGNIDRLRKLTDTIDKTIQHLEDKQSMKQEELYYGFDKKLPKSDQYVCLSRGTPAEKMLAHFKKDEVVWTEQQWADFKNDVDLLDKAIAQQIRQGAKPDNSKVQKLIQKQYERQENFFNLTKEAYLALIQKYEDDNGTIKVFFEAYHPEMQIFMCQAMRHYAKTNLK